MVEPVEPADPIFKTMHVVFFLKEKDHILFLETSFHIFLDMVGNTIGEIKSPFPIRARYQPI
jgi:hypothetical protein